MPVPPDPITFVRTLHASYESRTGYSIRWNLHRENQWSTWCNYSEWEWTDKELAIVISYLRYNINNGKRNEGALKFDNLIGNPPGFEEDLNLAKEARKSSGAAGARSRSQNSTYTPTKPEEVMPVEEAKALWADLMKKDL